MRVLVVEDHPDLAENIGDYLDERGHEVDYAKDGREGLHLALTGRHEVIVLDLMLPRMDGLALCRELRARADRQVPVLMLTARDTLPDKLAGFEAGTDDYLVKPFALQELEARLEALVQRGSGRRRLLAVDDLTLDTGTCIAYRDGRRLRLGRLRLELLKHLMEAAPNIVSIGELECALWGDDPPGSNALSVHIYALRRELERDDEPPLLHTVHGLGYRLGQSEA